jgi:hypothetical protein
MAVAVFGKILIGIYVEIKRSDGKTERYFSLLLVR